MTAAKPKSRVQCVAFGSFDDLDAKLRALLKASPFDLIVHAAAVSDYSAESVTVSGRNFMPSQLPKLDSSTNVRINLRRNFKILHRLSGYARGRPLIVAFKLTNGASAASIRQAISKLAGDFVVHNDLRDMKDGQTRKFRIFEAGMPLKNCGSRLELARALHKLVQERRKHAADSRRGQQSNLRRDLRRR